MTDNIGLVTARVSLDIKRCKSCGYCVAVCPKGVLEMSEHVNQCGYRYAEVVNADACIGCGLCFQMCPDLVIEVRDEVKDSAQANSEQSK